MARRQYEPGDVEIALQIVLALEVVERLMNDSRLAKRRDGSGGGLVEPCAKGNRKGLNRRSLRAGTAICLHSDYQRNPK
jgi:hypothetical protein